NDQHADARPPLLQVEDALQERLDALVDEYKVALAVVGVLGRLLIQLQELAEAEPLHVLPVPRLLAFGSIKQDAAFRSTANGLGQPGAILRGLLDLAAELLLGRVEKHD